MNNPEKVVLVLQLNNMKSPKFARVAKQIFDELDTDDQAFVIQAKLENKKVKPLPVDLLAMVLRADV